MDRNCNKCIHHTSGSCSAWECKGTVTVEDVRKNAIEECIEVVDKIIDDCVKNGGCRSKCDEPYACAYGTRIFGEILALKEQEDAENI